MTEPSTRQLRIRIFLLAGVPLMAALLAIAAVVWREADWTANRAIEAVQPLLRKATEVELRNYVGLALQSIDRAPNPQIALEVLRHLDFGWDGYFYVLDFDGNMLLHSRQPWREGANHWDDRAGDGSFPIQQIIHTAKQGGGFVEYLWTRPSSGVEERKLGYVATRPALGWIIGSGIYLGSLEEGSARIRASFSEAIQRTLLVIAAIAALSAIVVAAGGFALNLSGQRLAEARLRGLARQVVLELEGERRRLARTLHDDAMQELAAVKLTFEVIQSRIASLDTSLGAALRSGIQSLRDTMQSLRNLSHHLRPRLLDQLGLTGALAERLLDFEKQTGVGTRLDANLPGAALSEAVSIALFRVVGEALTNVSRHADAAHVDLRLEQTERGLDVRIRDDGRGFDPHEVRAHSPGLGLVHMTERIRMLGGRLTVRSDARGTELEIHLPKEALR